MPGPPLSPTDFPVCWALLAYQNPPVPLTLITAAVRELVAVVACTFQTTVDDRPVAAVELRRDSPPMAIPNIGVIALRQQTVAGDYRQQLVYNAAHEAQHYACIVGAPGTWVDEMLAEVFAVAVTGVLAPTYSSDTVQRHRTDGATLTYRDMASLPWPLDGVGGNTPPEIYARAFLTGEQLQAAVGWEDLRTFTGRTATREQVRPEAWITYLAPEKAVEARRILQI